MKRVLGLRTEIILSSGLLVGAALLFMTFLLLRLTETRLLDQAIRLHTEHSTALSMAVEHLPEVEMAQTVEEFARQHQLLYWRLVDQQMMPIAMSQFFPQTEQRKSGLYNALLGRSPQVFLNFPTLEGLTERTSPASFYVEITTSIRHAQGNYALQFCFSLSEIFYQLVKLAKTTIILSVGYGLILVISTIALLTPTFIRPVTLLTYKARQISEGELHQRAPESGPLEIAELGSAFNSMVDSLQNSLEEQRHQYHLLQKTHDKLKQARQHLAHSERISSIGTLTSGIAHELGNPLSASIGYLELLKHRCKEPKNLNLIERTLSETQRMDQLIKDLLDFTAPDCNPAHTDCAVSDCLGRTCDMLLQQGALKERHLKTDWPNQLGRVALSPLKLQQVLVNLILNARDATPPQGIITVSATENSSTTTITVTDNGHGIEAQQLDTIFDPFYTTKEPGKGRGLGLYVSYQLIRDANGHLEASSIIGKGSCFTLTLPKSSGDL